VVASATEELPVAALYRGAQQTDADADEQQPARDPEPRIKAFGGKGRRQRERDSQPQHPQGVGRRHRQSDAADLSQGAPFRHQIGGHDRFAMSRREGVHSTQRNGERQRDETDDQSQLWVSDQIGKGCRQPVDAAALGCCRRSQSGQRVGRRRTARPGTNSGGAHVQGGGQQIRRVGSKRATDALGRDIAVQQGGPVTGCGDLSPPDPVTGGVVPVREGRRPVHRSHRRHATGQP